MRILNDIRDIIGMSLITIGTKMCTQRTVYRYVAGILEQLTKGK